jgi:hypothetical protein
VMRIFASVVEYQWPQSLRKHTDQVTQENPIQSWFTPHGKWLINAELMRVSEPTPLPSEGTPPIVAPSANILVIVLVNPASSTVLSFE